MSSKETAVENLKDCSALWHIGAVRAYDVVTAACEALVAGLDGATLRRLAACTRAEADYDVPDLLPTAFEELGFACHTAGSRAAAEAGLRALAARAQAGACTARQLALEVHQRFGHELPLAARLAELDDEYDILIYTGGSAEDIDALVMAEARHLAHHRGEKRPAPSTTAPT